MKPGSGKASASVRLGKGVGHRPRKRFGQNFLRDEVVIDRIISSIHPQVQDHLLEIGPGQGALTHLLASSGARLDCVELDRDLVAFLQQSFADSERVRIFQQDILKFDIADLASEPRSLRIIGNLPYNISTPVLFHLIKSHTLIKDMTFMLQLEVVQRMSAACGEKNYGRLGLMLQYFCRVEHLFNVPSTAFSPQPKVSSAIVRLTPHQEFPLQARDVKCLHNVVRTAFNQRRKTLKNSLKTLIPEDVLQALPLDSSLRPENLSLADYVMISDAVSELSGSEVMISDADSELSGSEAVDTDQ